MNIILDAFFDNNFGDDLFISTVLNRYPRDTFYVFWNKVNPAVMARASAFQNLRILPGNCMLMDSISFDGYIMVGGDVFMNWGDYSRHISTMRAVKNGGGFVALQGFSLYEEYCEETIGDLRTIMSLADVIVPRDQATAERLEQMVPGISLIRSTDMAFTARYHVATEEKQEILGIAPRRKYLADDAAHGAYCASMAGIIDGWMDCHPHGIARFLAFSTGEFDDVSVSRDIIACMKHGEQTEIIAYRGDMEEFMGEMERCSAMLPTRFHALVFALIYGIPFVPVAYEVKIHQLLDELDYTALRLPYGLKLSDKMIRCAVEELEMNSVNADALEAYYKKADRFFVQTDELIARGRDSVAAAYGEFRCMGMETVQQELAALRQELRETRRRCESLEKVSDYYEDLLAKTKSFKGLAYLVAKKILRLFIKEKA